MNYNKLLKICKAKIYELVITKCISFSFIKWALYGRMFRTKVQVLKNLRFKYQSSVRWADLECQFIFSSIVVFILHRCQRKCISNNF
jgi:hypothetical protein